MRQDYDPTDVAAHEREKAESKAKARIEQATEDDDLKWLMSSRQGRRIVWRLLQRAGVFRLSFNTNAMQMAFAEGNRNYGNALLGQVMKLCPDVYPRMVKEANERDGDGNGSKSN